MTEKPQLPNVLLFTRSVLVLNCGFGLLRALGTSYSLTLVQVYSFVVLLLIEAIFEPFFGRVRWLAVGGVMAGTVWFSVAVTFSKAPIEHRAYLHPGDHPQDTQIAGIAWDSHFADLRFTLTNPTDEDYKTLDLTLKPDGWTYSAAILNPTKGCDLTPGDVGGKMKFAIASSAGARTFTATNKMDMYDSAGDIFSDFASTAGYRLRCDTLPSHYTIQVVFASIAVPRNLVNETPAPPGGMSMSATTMPPISKNRFDLLLPKPEPVEVQVTGHLTRSIKPFSINETVYVGDE